MSTSKNCFNALARRKSNIVAKKERLQILREMADGVGSSNITEMPKNPSPAQSRMEDAVCRAIDLEEEIKLDENRLMDERVRILELIGQIDGSDYQSVLINRYLRDYSWEDIAIGMKYSKRWVYKLHNRALKELDRILEKEDT